MQAISQKIIMFLVVSLLPAGQAVVGQRPVVSSRQADSLFAQRAYIKAIASYSRIETNERDIHPDQFLKMAYALERTGRDLDALRYLNRYYERHPSEAILRKMTTLAEKHGWQGFEYNDLNLLVLLYKQYGPYLIGFMLGLGSYVFWVLAVKKTRHQYILPRHKVVFVVYLLGISVLINLPDGYAVAIVQAPRAILREDPSAGAPIADAVGRGNRLSVLGNNDIWLRVVWNNRLTYIRRKDVWLIK